MVRCGSSFLEKEGRRSGHADGGYHSCTFQLWPW